MARPENDHAEVMMIVTIAKLSSRKSRRGDGEEAPIRQSRFRTGFIGMWDWVRGEDERIRESYEIEAKAAAQRDRGARHAHIRAA